MPIISSPHNARIKLVRALQRQAKIRRQQRQLVLEGVRLIQDAIATGMRPDFVCYTEDATAPTQALVARLQDEGSTCLVVTEGLMQGMADTATPQGILGVFAWPDLLAPTAPNLILVADGWRDPGNLGTVIRTAAAAGVDLVALAPGTVDPTNPKTLRAGMGAQFRVPVHALTWPEITERGGACTVYVADAAGDTVYTAVDWIYPAMIIVGGEAYGISDAARAMISTQIHTTLHIPMLTGSESLNAAVAASLLIYEARRHG